MGNSHNAKSNACPVRVLHAEHASKKWEKVNFMLDI